MNKKIKYPTVEEITEANNVVLKEIAVSRKDYHRVYHEDRIDKSEFLKKVKIIIEKERNFLERVGRL